MKSSGKQKKSTFSYTTKAYFKALCHEVPVCLGLMKVSFDCATATTFEIFTDGAPDALRDETPVSDS